MVIPSCREECESLVVCFPAAIETTVSKLDSNFKDLTSKMCKEILKNGTTIDELRITIVIYLNDEDMPVSATEQKNLTDILASLVRNKQHYNFLNYSLLDILVKNFGNKKLKKEMEHYKVELKKFRQTTALCEFVEYFEAQTIFSVEDLQDFLVKVKGDWKKFTLEDMETIKRNITQKFFLPSFVMLLKSIKPGCIEIIWSIYAPFVELMLNRMKKENLVDFLTDNMLTCLYFDEECIYSVVKEYSTFLKSIYSKIEEVKGLVPPQLVEIVKLGAGGRAIKFPVTEHQIGVFNANFDAQRRLILIEGASKLRNKVFSKYCCHKWSQGELFGNLDLLLLLPLNNSKVASAEQLQDLFDHPKKPFLAEEIARYKGEGMALWLDGWDDLSEKNRSCSIFTNLLCGDILPQAMIIITCHSWATNELKTFCVPDQHLQMNPEFDGKLEIGS